MNIETGTHIIRVGLDDTMMDGFRVEVATSDGNGNATSEFSADANKIYRMKYGARAVYAEIIRNLLVGR